MMSHWFNFGLRGALNYFVIPIGFILYAFIYLLDTPSTREGILIVLSSVGILVISGLALNARFHWLLRNGASKERRFEESMKLAIAKHGNLFVAIIPVLMFGLAEDYPTQTKHLKIDIVEPKNSVLINTDLESQRRGQSTSNESADAGLTSEKRVVQRFLPDGDSEEPQSMQFLFSAKQFFDQFFEGEVEPEKRDAVVKFYREITALIINENWESTFELASKYDFQVPEIYDIALQILAQENAPLETLREFTDVGATLTPPALLSLVRHDALGTVQYYENLGVRLDSEITDGFSMLELALMGPLSEKAFDFILSRDSPSANYNELGLDTLGIAIVNAATNRQHSTQIIRKLINAGAVVNPHHRQLLAGLALEAPSVHSELIANIPDLR